MALLDNLPKVIRKELAQDDVKAQTKTDDKPFILVISRDLEQAELDILTSYGKVLIWRPSYVNIPLSQHEFDYCIVDARRKEDRSLLASNALDSYHVVVITHKYLSLDDVASDVGAENVIHKLPQHQAFKETFDRLLISKKVRSPSCVKSIIRFLLSLANGFPEQQ